MGDSDALVEKRIRTEKFAEDADEDNTTWKARGPSKHSIYVLRDTPQVSPR